MIRRQKLIVLTILYLSFIVIVIVKYHEKQRRHEVGSGQSRNEINESILLDAIKKVDGTSGQHEGDTPI